MSKKNAALTLGGLSLGTMVLPFMAQPNLAYFMSADYSTFFQIGQQVGSALATALGMPILELVGMVLFIA